MGVDYPESAPTDFEQERHDAWDKTINDSIMSIATTEYPITDLELLSKISYQTPHHMTIDQCRTVLSDPQYAWLKEELNGAQKRGSYRRICERSTSQQSISNPSKLTCPLGFSFDSFGFRTVSEERT